MCLVNRFAPLATLAPRPALRLAMWLRGAVKRLAGARVAGRWRAPQHSLRCQRTLARSMTPPRQTLQSTPARCLYKAPPLFSPIGQAAGERWEPLFLKAAPSFFVSCRFCQLKLLFTCLRWSLVVHMIESRSLVTGSAGAPQVTRCGVKERWRVL